MEIERIQRELRKVDIRIAKRQRELKRGSFHGLKVRIKMFVRKLK